MRTDVGHVGRLVAVSGTRAGRKYVVRDALVIGRATECDVLLDDGEVSRRHARVSRDDDGNYLLQDLGSRNGTFVNGVRIEEVNLAFGDKFRLGQGQIFVLTPHDPVEEQLLHRQRLETLGRLTAGVAHDLNNMLGAVAASIAYLRELPPGERDSEEADGCIDDIGAAASRAGELASRLLAFSRSGGDRAQTVDVSDICAQAVKLARRTFERAINIDAAIVPELYVAGDGAQLQQVFMNLLVNARDAIAHENGGAGTIRVSADRAVREGISVIRMSVADDGIGMDDHTKARIFEPFFTTKQAGAGFGLGLSMVAEIVKNHGGRINVTSRPNEGASFTLELLAARAEKDASATPTYDDQSLPTRSHEVRVLIVDDEPVIRRSLARVLRRGNLDVAAAGTGAEAMALVEAGAFSPTVVVIDLELPDIAGEDLVTTFRERQVQVVCISGHRDESREREARMRGASTYMLKPFEPNELLTAVMRAHRVGSESDTATTATGLHGDKK